MTLDSLLHASFGDTTIDPKSIKKFIKEDPNYLGWGYDQNVDEACKDILNRADFFEFHYRRYLLGFPKTLHRVLHEVRTFRANHPDHAYYFIKHSIGLLRKRLLDEEWYELMPRLQKSAKKIESVVPNPGDETIPLLLVGLMIFYPGHEKMRE